MDGGELEAGVDGGGADGVAVGGGAGHVVFGVDGDDVAAAGGDEVGELAQGGACAAQGVADGVGVGALSAGVDGPASGSQCGGDSVFVQVSDVFAVLPLRHGGFLSAGFCGSGTNFAVFVPLVVGYDAAHGGIR